MDKLDQELLRTRMLALEDLTDEVEAELDELRPALVAAGYIKERPWGEDTGWVLWSFTKRGVERAEELEALDERSDDQE